MDVDNLNNFLQSLGLAKRPRHSVRSIAMLIKSNRTEIIQRIASYCWTLIQFKFDFMTRHLFYVHYRSRHEDKSWQFSDVWGGNGDVRQRWLHRPLNSARISEPSHRLCSPATHICSGCRLQTTVIYQVASPSVVYVAWKCEFLTLLDWRCPLGIHHKAFQVEFAPNCPQPMSLA